MVNSEMFQEACPLNNEALPGQEKPKKRKKQKRKKIKKMVLLLTSEMFQEAHPLNNDPELMLKWRCC
jgi:hypothetical protein